MLCKQLVSATQGLQPKLLSSSNALVQLALIQASTLLLLFHLLCSMSSLPHYGSHVRPTKVDLPTPHTDHCLTPLFSHPVRAQALQPHPGKQLSLGKAWPAQEDAWIHHVSTAA